MIFQGQTNLFTGDTDSIVGNSSFVKSPMCYTGGKYRLLKQIMPLMPRNIKGLFFDVFCGGLDVTINAPRCSGIVANDLNDKVIGIYRTMQNMSIDDILAFMDETIERFSLSMTNADGYNALRDEYNNAGPDVNKPMLLFVLLCYSFNHQIRFNGKGEFNMPFGKDRSYFNSTLRTNLISFHKILTERNITFRCGDFSSIDVNGITPDDFVYCDPPYLITTATYNEGGGWDGSNEIELLSFLDDLNDKGVKFALSNVLSSKGRTNEILTEWVNDRKGYTCHHLDYNYSNASYHTKDRNTGSDEVLITNY